MRAIEMQWAGLVMLIVPFPVLLILYFMGW